MMGLAQEEIARIDSLYHLGIFTDEGPQHPVILSRVSAGEIRAYTGAVGECDGTKPWAGQDNVQENMNNPAVDISWDDVQAFIGW